MGYMDLSSKKAAAGRPIRATLQGMPFTVQFGNTSRLSPLGKIKRVTMHWSVGPYDMAFDDYHVNIIFDVATGKAHVIKTLKFTELGEHAFKANTGNLGVGFAAMMKTDPDTCVGKYPITTAMQAVAAVFVAEFLCWYGLTPDAVTDHKRVDIEIGRKSKIDIGPYFEGFVEMVRYHYGLLKAGTVSFQYKGLLTE